MCERSFSIFELGVWFFSGYDGKKGVLVLLILEQLISIEYLTLKRPIEIQIYTLKEFEES